MHGPAYPLVSGAGGPDRRAAESRLSPGGGRLAAQHAGAGRGGRTSRKGGRAAVVPACGPLPRSGQGGRNAGDRRRPARLRS